MQFDSEPFLSSIPMLGYSTSKKAYPWLESIWSERSEFGSADGAEVDPPLLSSLCRYIDCPQGVRQGDRSSREGDSIDPKRGGGGSEGNGAEVEVKQKHE